MIIAIRETQIPPDQLVAHRQLVAGLAILWNGGDAKQPGGRGDADLQPVDIADQPIQRLHQGLHVQGRRGHLAQAHPAIHVADAAEDQHHRQRCVVREADHDEQQVAQCHRVALGLCRYRDVRIALLDPIPLEPRASTVRAPSTVSVNVELIWEYVPPSVM